MAESWCRDCPYLEGDADTDGGSGYLSGILGGVATVLLRLASVSSVLLSHLMPKLLVSASRDAFWIC